MRVLTVRSVATFLRAPWCNSMVIVFLDGWEKQTERWDISLTRLPAMRKEQYFYPLFWLWWHTSRTLHTNYPRFDVYLDYSNVSVIPQWSSKLPVALRPGFREAWQSSSSAQTRSLEADSPLAGIVSVSSECMYLILFSELGLSENDFHDIIMLPIYVNLWACSLMVLAAR